MVRSIRNYIVWADKWDVLLSESKIHLLYQSTESHGGPHDHGEFSVDVVSKECT